MEAEILIEIKEAEKKADEIIERAKVEKEYIIKEAVAKSSKMLASAVEETFKLQEKKLADFKEKSKLVREEKVAESKTTIKQLKAKSEKNMPIAVDFVLKKFEETI